MIKKIIINAVFAGSIKFKIAFDTQNDTATFVDLKAAILKRLENFSQVAPEALKQKIPASFQVQEFVLTDNSGFQLQDEELVSDLCKDNDIIELVEVNALNQSIVLSMSSIQTIHVPPQAQSTQQSVAPQQQKQVPPADPPQPTIQNAVLTPMPDPPQQVQHLVSAADVIQLLRRDLYLKTDNLRLQQQMIEETSDLKLSLVFPQSQDPTEEFPFYTSIKSPLLELSNSLAKAIGVDSDKFTFVFYNHWGLAYHPSLNQVHQLTVENTLAKTHKYSNRYFVFATQCVRGAKSHAKIDHDTGEHQLFVLHNGTKVIRADINKDTVLQLKQKIYSKLDIPTTSQSLNYGGKTLVDQVLLKDYNIQQNSNITLLFKQSEVVGTSQSFQYNFYSPWMQHFRQQSEEGQRIFRSHLYVICAQLDPAPRAKFLALIRDLSQNNAPLVSALNSAMNRMRLSQLQKIAIEEGLIRLFAEIMVQSQDVPDTLKSTTVFEWSRYCFASLITTITEMKNVPTNWTAQEKYRSISSNCQITLKAIGKPGLLHTDLTNTSIVDYDDILEKQTNNVTVNNKDISGLKLTSPDWLNEQFELIRGGESEVFIWIPGQDYLISQETLQLTLLKANWHTKADPLPNAPFKIYSSIELKQNPSPPVLTKNSSKQLAVYTSMNKDVKKPVTLFEVISGVEQPENPDDIAFKHLNSLNKTRTTTSADSDSDDEPVNVVTQITVPPDEAIVVVLDISGSMEEIFFNSEDLQRIGAVKAFFSAFADRTMAYNLKHVISLVFFDDKYELKCSFTEVFAQFKDLVNRAKPRGMTALYDALMKAADSLVEIKQKYPQCLLRIIALTDGEDNRSGTQPETAALKIVSNDIILDSFVAGPKSDCLKQITHTTGGKCFCPKTLSEGLKYFEYETILSAKCRVKQPQLKHSQLINIKSVLTANKKKPFDDKAHDIQVPDQMRRGSVNPNQLVRQISMDSNQLDQIAPSAALKRVVQEMINYHKDAHPFVKIFPCDNDVSFWKVVLLGPEDTPYFGGVYTLYIRFPHTFPTQPPQVRFVTPIYHCNINQQGRICHSILDRNYTPDTRVKQIFECIYGLLMTPEPDDPLDNTIASEYLQDLAAYRIKASAHTAANAKQPLDEVLKGILGQQQGAQQSDNDMHEKLEALSSWIANSLQNKEQKE